ncbi:MAG: BON domain-containing protein [Vicinamibacteria bacterium]|nr:BON domain-containing protein [Vicinamibacteria bacterium]
MHARVRRPLALAVASLAATLSAGAQQEARPDAALAKDTQRAILRYASLTVFDNIEYGVQDGVVLLRGSVQMPYRSQALEKRVAAVPGVTRVVNEIRVQPVSLFDNEIRHRLVRAIYGDPRFAHYAHMPEPPIRIVVENGRVTLAGVVVSRVEQVLLGFIARQSVLAFDVKNEVQVESEIRREAKRS